MKKEKKTKDEKSINRAEKKRIKHLRKKFEPLTTEEIVPIVRFDDVTESFLTTDGTYIDFLEINTKDLQSASDDSIQYEEMCFEKLYKIYPDDLKLISFNFPVDTSKQQEYIEKIYEKTENPIYREFLETYNAQLMWISEKRFDREYILLFYSKSIEEHKNNYLTITTTLSGLRHSIVSKIPVVKKKEIAFKLFNKNTVI